MDYTDAKSIRAIIDADEAALHDIREAYRDDTKFAILGEQWDEAQLEARRRRKRPAIVDNRLPAFIRHVVNGARQNEVAVRVYPLGDGASKAAAELLDSRIRAIQIMSDADSARCTALECACAGGFGWYRVRIEGEGDEARPIIEGVRDPLAVIWDSAAIRTDRMDIRHLAYMSTMGRKEFEAKYGREPVAFSSSSLWTPSQDCVAICEFWYADGAGKVFQVILDGEGIVEEPEEFPCSILPWVFVPGEEYFVDGKIVFKGIVRDAKEPQRFRNFWKSEVAEQIQSKKTPPAIVDAKSIVGPDGEVFAEWKDTEGNYAYRRVVDPAFPPILPGPAQIPTGAASEASQAVDDIKAAIGIYDASLGARSNEQSGRAIIARQQQGDLATYHYQAARERGVRVEGLILVDIEQRISSKRKWLQVAGEDGEVTTQELGGIMRLRDGSEAPASIPADARFGVVVKSGQSFSSRRAESASTLSDLARSVPQLGQIGADVLVRALDFPGGDELADRLRTMYEKQGLVEPKQKATPQQQAAQLAQAVEAIQKLTKEVQVITEERSQLAQELKDAQDGIAQEIAKAQISAAAMLEKARIDAAAKIEAARIDADAEKEVALLKSLSEQSLQDAKSQAAQEQAVLEAELIPPALPPEEVVGVFDPGAIEPRGFIQ